VEQADLAERIRLEILSDLELVGSEPSRAFDDVVALAADMFECPIALVTLVGEHDQWFKAKCGLEIDGTERDAAFCATTIRSSAVLVVEDASGDPRFKNNRLVTREPGIRFYAGYPLSLDGHNRLGSLCVIDRKPRSFSVADRQRLQRLGHVVEGLIRAFQAKSAAQSAHNRLEIQRGQLRSQTELLERVTATSGVGGWELQLPSGPLYWTRQTKAIHELPPDFEPDLASALDFYHPDSRLAIATAVAKAMTNGSSWDLELQLVTARSNTIWVRAIGNAVTDNGKVVRLIGTFQDITEHRRMLDEHATAEQLASEQASELNVIINNMNEGISVFDAEGRLVRWNQRYIDIFAKPEGEVRCGVPLTHLIQQERQRGDFNGDVDAHIGELRDHLGRGEVVTSRFSLANGTVVQSVHAPTPSGGWIGTHSDITAMVEADRHNAYLANHDPLTGLANRLQFDRALQKAMADTGADRQDFALMLIDLDHFKPVNDQYGHAVGDEVLKHVAERLRVSLPAGCLAARIGGDEFAVIVTPQSSGRDELEFVSAATVRALGQPCFVDRCQAKLSASIGVTVIVPHERSAGSALLRADTALYACKADGRNGFRFFDDSLINADRSRRGTTREASNGDCAPQQHRGTAA
jgi:diguanylate cyclase (GGDEF)-like protein